jgi:hypothetical protein
MLPGCRGQLEPSQGKRTQFGGGGNCLLRHSLVRSLDDECVSHWVQLAAICYRAWPGFPGALSIWLVLGALPREDRERRDQRAEPDVS